MDPIMLNIRTNIAIAEPFVIIIIEYKAAIVLARLAIEVVVPMKVIVNI